MEQKHVRIIGIFLALIMVTSVMALFFGGSGNSSSRDGDATDLEDAPGFEIISGTQFNAEMNSLSDGLAFTPEGVSNAIYVDYSRTYGTPLQDYNITDLYAYYNTLMVKRFSAYDSSSNFGFEAHVLTPEVVNFNYATAGMYNGYSLLQRGTNIYNIIGTPTLLGDRNTLEKVIDVRSGTGQSSTDFTEIMSYVESGAEFQRVSSSDTIAEQYYVEFRNMGDGNYTRTEIFVAPADTTVNAIYDLEATSDERDLLYNITLEDEGRIVKVVISTDASNFFNLAMEQFR
ncbi:MAG: hypothetical protein QCH31_04760 [Methanolobus sp.]|nr:hypothetical protein [Methanolobus sp.]